jgi:ACT domain-containing protein
MLPRKQYCLWRPRKSEDMVKIMSTNHLRLILQLNYIKICELIESKLNEIIDTVNKMDSAIEADPLHTELRILDWILYQICSNEIKRI